MMRSYYNTHTFLTSLTYAVIVQNNEPKSTLNVATAVDNGFKCSQLLKGVGICLDGCRARKISKSCCGLANHEPCYLHLTA